MSKAATLNGDEAHYKAQAKHYLVETQKILRRLATERQRATRRSHPQTNLLDEVREILYGK
jgi:hypothetical protein